MKSLSKVLTSIIGSGTLAAPVISTPYFVFSKSNDSVLEPSHEDSTVLDIANKDNPKEPGAMIPTPQPVSSQKPDANSQPQQQPKESVTPKQSDQSDQSVQPAEAKDVTKSSQKPGKRVLKKNLYGPFVTALKGFVDYGKRSIRKNLEKKMESLGIGKQDMNKLWDILKGIAKSGSGSSAPTDSKGSQGAVATP